MADPALEPCDFYEEYEERVLCSVHRLWVTLWKPPGGMPEGTSPECEGCVLDALAAEAEFGEGLATMEGRL